jgi:hypothetical protein
MSASAKPPRDRFQYWFRILLIPVMMLCFTLVVLFSACTSRNEISLARVVEPDLPLQMTPVAGTLDRARRSQP